MCNLNVCKQKTGIVIILLAFVVLSLSTRRFIDGNHFSRLGLLEAIVHRGDYALSNDAAAQTTGVVSVNNKQYSDKAPGVVLLALPAYWLASKVSSACGLEPQHSRWFRESIGIICVLPYCVLGLIACFAALECLVSKASVLIWGIACFCLPPVLYFTNVLMPHGMSVSFLWMAFYFILRKSDNSSRVFSACCGGICAGFAVACEYDALICAVMILHTRQASPWQWFAWYLGCAIGMIPILINNFLVYSEFFVVPYTGNQYFPHMRQGLAGVTFVPDVVNLLQSLFSLRKGIFPWNLSLLTGWVVAGIAIKSNIRLVSLSITVILAHVLTMSSYQLPDAGGWVGARLLCPMVPWLLVVGAIGCQLSRRATYIAFAAVCVSCATAMLIVANGGEATQDSTLQAQVSHLLQAAGSAASGPVEMLRIGCGGMAFVTLCLTSKLLLGQQDCNVQ